MIFTPTALRIVFVIEPERHADERGSFAPAVLADRDASFPDYQPRPGPGPS